MSDYREKFTNQIINKEIKGLGHDDSFEFSCNICGSCCRNRNDILLSSYDVFRLSKHLEMSPYEMINKYCDRYIGGDSKLPIVSIKFKTIDNLGKTYTACPFLKHRDGLVKCTVHEAKPFVCAAYPLGRAFKNEDDVQSVAYYRQDVTCGGKGKTQTVREWLDSYALSDSEEAFLVFTNFITDIYRIINLKKLYESKDISDDIKNTFYSMLINVMYVDYHIDEPFLEQYKRNIEIILERAKELVTLFYVSGIDIKGRNFKVDTKSIYSILKKNE